MRPTMKAIRGDRAVIYQNEYGETARVHAWDNGGFLTLSIEFDENAAVTVEVNRKEVGA